ncbi:DNA-3-methyladenine glycosylase I [bacterium]|nr:DNA-3-methyladenine glycosylase I [bacterium]
MKRCFWCGELPLYCDYHDKEWGVPVKDEQTLFEYLILEGAQAGLSWLTVLKKRENYREAFDGFDIERVSRFNKRKIESLLKNEGIIRNKLKVNSAVQNAKAFLRVQDEFGGFSAYQWALVGGKPKQNHLRSRKDIAARTELSDAFSKDLKKRGFNFVGSTIMYAYMQATGMVNDHFVDCHRYKKVTQLGEKFKL